MMRRRLLGWSEQLLLAAGLALTGYVAAVVLESALLRRAAERELEAAGGSRTAAALSGVSAVGAAAGVSALPEIGSPIGQLAISRLGLSEIVLEGIEVRTLRFAAGHVPGTALPGAAGTVAIAGHRDRAFRRLRDVRAGDLVTLRTTNGIFLYEIDSLGVVEPTETRVLEGAQEPRLALVTCYPFHYLGPAPKRFVASGRLIID